MRSQGGRGPQTYKTPAEKSLCRSIFQITTFDIAFYQSNLSTVLTLYSKEGMVDLAREERLGQVTKELLEDGGHVMDADITSLSYRNLQLINSIMCRSPFPVETYLSVCSDKQKKYTYYTYGVNVQLEMETKYVKKIYEFCHREKNPRKFLMKATIVTPARIRQLRVQEQYQQIL